MWSGIRNILEITWKYAKPFDRGVGLVLILGLILMSLFCAMNEPLYTNYRAIWILVNLLLYAMAIAPPVKGMTDRRHELVFYVAIWGLLSVVIFVVAFYGMFFVLLPLKTDRDALDRLLNVPPILGALGVAAIGWYVHQQLSAKLHRTSNSFALVMQTRTSAEYLKYSRIAYSIYPPPVEFPDGDLKYLEPKIRIEVNKIIRDMDRNPEKRPESFDEIDKIEAVEGLKYLLNFFEFMAEGIHEGDLDEKMLYETLSPSVVSWYDRSAIFCNQLRSTPGNKLAYQHLRKLVEGHKTMVANKPVDIDGWKNRLEFEKFNYK